MNQEATGKTYLDSLPADLVHHSLLATVEALCEGGSRSGLSLRQPTSMASRTPNTL